MSRSIILTDNIIKFYNNILYIIFIKEVYNDVTLLETMIAGRKLKVEYGKIGMLSNCAIFMSYGDTVVMVNVNASEKPREGIDFFPLSVEYEERLYSVGKIPGGFIKREGRPSEKSILHARAIDRPLKTTYSQKVIEMMFK